MRGRLDVSAVQRALAYIVARHEVLRTTFASEDGSPLQLIGHSRPVDVPVEDLRHASAETRAAETERLLRLAIQSAFDLAKDLMLRALLVRLADDEHILLVVTHHIASDAWSSNVLWQEFGTLYQAYAAGQIPALPPLPIQYADYAVWQRDWLQGEVLSAQTTYWKRRLAAAPPTLGLPLRRPRPAVQGYLGARQSIVLPRQLSDQLKLLGRREGVTLFVTLLAAFQTLLHRYTAQDDILIGSPTAGRARVETESLIGCFANTLVLRSDVSGNPSFRELLGRVREVVLEAQAHQDLPFEKVVEELQPGRSLSHSTFFQVMFVLQNESNENRTFGDLAVEPLDIHSGTAKFDLLLSTREDKTGMMAALEYNTELFDPSTIGRILDHFQMVLTGIVHDPDRRLSDLPLLTNAERHQLLVTWNDTHRDVVTDHCVHHLVEAEAEGRPDAVAVVCQDEALTYRELNARANQVARYLSKRGVGPEVRVGLCLPRSVDMVVALLGILKAGGAYVPLDPSYPKQRLAFMIEDARLPVVVTDGHLASRLPAHRAQQVLLDTSRETIAQESAENPVGKATAENAVYVLYTSGSTGVPKGVVMEHRALCNLISWQIENSGPTVGTRTLQFAPQSFDVAFQEIFSTWCAGGTLVLVSEEVRRDPNALLQFLAAERVERAFLPFVALKQLADAVEETKLVPIRLREIVTAGEQLHVTPSIARLIERLEDGRLCNQYGPTETHVVTAFTITGPAPGGAAFPPIGRPIANCRVYVLDRHMQPVPVGVVGELHVGGIALARGYLHRPELTAAKFIPDPFDAAPGARLYKTGDLARLLPDGNIEFLGRLDDQVKLRGFRIEPGEIEAVLGEHPRVRQSTVVLREDVHEDKRLTAYVVARDEPTSLVDELRLFLKARLPAYMIPSAFAVLESLPLTPSGKVDRRSLPLPARIGRDGGQAFVAPRTTIEVVLAELWRQLLGVEQVGVDDNFFDLGGHSLLVTRLVAQIEQRLQVDLPVRVLFESPTLAEFAARIHADGHPRVQREPIGGQSYWVRLQAGQGRPLLFCFPHFGGFRMDLVRFVKLARLVGSAYSFYGLQAEGTDDSAHCHKRLEDMVTEYVVAMKTVQPHGPYFLLGECFSGRVAYATAQRLRGQGEQVAFLGLLEVRNPHQPLARYLWNRLTARMRYRLDGVVELGIRTWLRSRMAVHRGASQRLARDLRLLLSAVRRDLSTTGESDARAAMRRQSQQHARAQKAYWLAVDRYRRRPYAGRITVFVNEEWYRADPTLGWTQQLATGGIEVHKIPGNHDTYITDHIDVLGSALRQCLEAAASETQRS